MSTSKKSSRRNFLRNSTLATISAGVLPNLLGAAETVIPADGAVDCFPTTKDYYGQGPFYTPNAPIIPTVQLASAAEPGERLVISGIVKTLDCSEIIPGTIIDIWHANDGGQYDNAGFNLRGIIQSNAQGFYLFETVLPGKYLNGGSFRPRHIHLKITPPGFPTLTTQLYFAGDTSIPGDAAASITSGVFDASHRIIPLTTDPQGKLQGVWDIILDGDGISSASDLHLDKGMVYSVAPNPFTDGAEIKYGVFKNAHVRMEVFNALGARLAILVDEAKTPQKYSAIWKAPADIPAGHYWVTLKMDDLQVHYFKIMKY